MTIYKEIKNQIVAGTRLDLQGERRSREFFEKLLATYPPRMPLHQEHDLRKDVIGYMDNFRLVEDTKELGEWNVIADVYFTSDKVNEAQIGFSYSATEACAGNFNEPIYSIFLPYPFYNDEALIKEIVDSDEHVLVGKFIKKAFGAEFYVGLAISGMVLLIGPEWDSQYKENIRPHLVRLLTLLPQLWSRGIATDIIQMAMGRQGEAIQIMFIPDRSEEILSRTEAVLAEGLKRAHEFLSTDEKAATIGVERLKLYFDVVRSGYVIFHVQYLDGTDLHHV